MRVLQISANWGRGGPGGIMKDLYNATLASGNECYVAFGRKSVPQDVYSIRIGTSFDVYAHVLFARAFDSAGFHSVSATKKFVRRIEALKPDLIHLHNLAGYYINIPVLFDYLRKKQIPVVWTLHDCWAYTGHCINYDWVGCEEWKRECRRCPLKRDYPKSWLLSNAPNNLKRKKRALSGINMTLVSPSKWMAANISNTFLSQYPLEVIPNGIDLSIFHPTESDLRRVYGLEQKKIVLAVAGVWNEMKGEAIVLKLADILGNDYAVVMIGKKAKEPTGHRVISIPHTENIEQLAKWYTMADVFINPTLGDNFPTVNIEALACGTPVVTNNTGGSPETAGNDCGLIVYSKTAEEFAEKIEECLAQNFSRDACCERAKQYDHSICAARYRELYENMLANEIRHQPCVKSSH